MRKFFGVVLMVVGIGWAGIGVSSCFSTYSSHADETEMSDGTAVGLGLVGMFSGVFFLLPGLFLTGMGAITYK